MTKDRPTYAEYVASRNGFWWGGGVLFLVIAFGLAAVLAIWLPEWAAGLLGGLGFGLAMRWDYLSVTEAEAEIAHLPKCCYYDPCACGRQDYR